MTRTRTGHRSLLSRAPVVHPNEKHRAPLQLTPLELKFLHGAQDPTTLEGALLRIQISTVCENVIAGRWKLGQQEGTQ